MKRSNDIFNTRIIITLIWGAAIGQIALGLWLVSLDFGIIGYPIFITGIIILSGVFPSVYSGNNKKKLIKKNKE
jgi:hypothetical protein